MVVQQNNCEKRQNLVNLTFLYLEKKVKTKLSQLIADCLDNKMPTNFYKLEEGHWIYIPHITGVIIHLEETCVDDIVFIHGSLSMKDEYFMIKSFLAGMMDEDSFAFSIDGIGVWSTEKSVSYFIKRSICNLNYFGLSQLVSNFAQNLLLKEFAVQQERAKGNEDEDDNNHLSLEFLKGI